MQQKRGVERLFFGPASLQRHYLEGEEVKREKNTYEKPKGEEDIL